MSTQSDHASNNSHFASSVASEHRGSVSDIMRSIDVEEEKEKQVLVVDDDNTSRKVLSKMLKKLSFKGI
jgi:PleD family two-component response regulator